MTLDVLIRLEACHDKIQSLQTECLHATSPEEENVIVDLLSKWKSLKFLRWIAASERRPTQVRIISRVAPSYGRLKVIHLSPAGHRQEFRPHGALEFVALCPKLQIRRLCNWKFNARSFTVLAAGVQSHASLARLEVSQCEIVEAGWWALMDSLERNRSIVRFSFAETRILRANQEAYPSRVVWESLAVVLQDHNDCLQVIAPLRTAFVDGADGGDEDAGWSVLLRVCRLLELNRAGYRRRLPL